MQIPATLRSATALVLALVLSGATVLSMVPCEAPSAHPKCPMDVAQETEHATCHDTEAPPAQMSCCCGADHSPVQPTGNDTRIADAAASATDGLADAAPARTVHQVVEATTVRTRTRPLFTLFSVFLI